MMVALPPSTYFAPAIMSRLFIRHSVAGPACAVLEFFLPFVFPRLLSS